VGNDKSAKTKNAGKSLLILIAMLMRRYDARREAHCPIEHIQSFT
jgi:hypothetical protein